MSSNNDRMQGAMTVFGLIILASLAYILFKISKLVYSYSRSALLSVWTFLALAGLLFMSFVFSEVYYGSYGWLLAGLWIAGVGSIFFSTYTLYKKKKSEVDKLIEEEAYVERLISENSENSENSSNTKKLLIGAGALYAGYALGKKTGL